MNLSEVISLIKQNKDAAIFIHTRPDGDAIGSAVALRYALETLGKKVSLHSDAPLPEKYAFLAGREEFKQVYQKHELLISLDCADSARLSVFEKDFLKAKNTLNIDHHISNTKFAKVNYVGTKAACAMIIYDIMKELNITPDKKTADALLAGISSDTGNFAHKNVTAECLVEAAQLIKHGADLSYVNEKLYRNSRIERMRLLGNALSNLRLFESGRIIVMYNKEEDLKTYGATEDMSEGFIDNALSVNTVEIAICLTQVNKTAYKVSFRSKSYADVNMLAQEFGGGGHKFAAGCNASGFFEDVVTKLVRAAAFYL